MRYALKRYKEGYQQHIVQEHSVLAQVSHAHVMRVYGVCTEASYQGGASELVVELLQNGELFELV